MQKLSQQSGQVLVSSLVLLFFLLMLLMFFFFVTESYLRNYSNINIARNEILKEKNEIANILNELSINNYLIVQSLSIAQKAFLQASELSLYQSFTQPYWKTHSTFEKSKEEKSFDNYLSEETKKDVRMNFMELQKKSARGLSFSKALVERNKILLNKLPKNISQYFIFSTNKSSFCISLEIIDSQLNRPGFFYFPPLEFFYPFYFKQKDCKVMHKTKRILNFNRKINFLSYQHEDEFFILDNLLLSSKNIDYGILYVPYKNSKFFLKNLLSLAPKNVIYKNNYSVFYKYINNIFGGYFLSKSTLNKYSRDIYSRIIHPNLSCPLNLRDNLDMLADLQNYIVSNCTLKENDFLFSFFLPHWAAVIELEKDITNYAIDK